MAGTDTHDGVPQLHALRAEVDGLDERLLHLLVERREVSQRIQAVREGLGHFGIQPAREDAVVAGYVAALGPYGRDVAEAVLLLCRGAVGDDRR